DLAETLEADLELAFEPKDRLALLSRLGVVRLDKLKNVQGAIEAHQQALTFEPSHATSRDALEGLLADADVRRDVAMIRRPVYEAEGDQTRLLRVLDIEAEYAETTEQKLATIARAAGVAEGPLADAPRAFAYVARGLKEAVGEPDFRTWLERAEGLADRAVNT